MIYYYFLNGKHTVNERKYACWIKLSEKEGENNNKKSKTKAIKNNKENERIIQK